jgi:hypothetical protein
MGVISLLAEGMIDEASEQASNGNGGEGADQTSSIVDQANGKRWGCERLEW